MNVIVSNKQKNILDNANIDAIKELNGLFQVDDLINIFKNYFFTKMIVDATSIAQFANPEVLKKLVNGIGAEKLVILLPKRPEPPQTFLDLLISLGVYNFSSDINDIIKFLQVPNTYDSISNQLANEKFDYNSNTIKENDFSDVKFDYFDINTQNSVDGAININRGNNLDNMGIKIENVHDKYILGIKNITVHAGTTSLIYMIKRVLEYKFNKKVLAIEVNTNDFVYFKSNNMMSVNVNNLEAIVKNSNCDVILIDLNNCGNYFDAICNDILYLIEPSIISVNRLISHNQMILSSLKNKKVVLNKSLLSNDDIKIFSKEAGIPFYFAIPPLNDRVGNSVIETLINKLNFIVK